VIIKDELNAGDTSEIGIKSVIIKKGVVTDRTLLDA